MSGSVKRPYDSSGRQDQARRTRARIVESATALFIERGYAATSMAAIAARAGVAPQTIYGAFGTKSAVLVEAIGVAMAGDDEPLAVLDRPAAREALTAQTTAEAAAAIAELSTRLFERAAGLLQAAEAAAHQDPEIARLGAEGQKLRLADMRSLATALDRAGHLREDLTVAQATDLLFVLASPDSFRSLTQIRGWTPARYERWLRATIEQTVLRT